MLVVRLTAVHAASEDTSARVQHLLSLRCGPVCGALADDDACDLHETLEGRCVPLVLQCGTGKSYVEWGSASPAARLGSHRPWACLGRGRQSEGFMSAALG